MRFNFSFCVLLVGLLLVINCSHTENNHAGITIAEDFTIQIEVVDTNGAPLPFHSVTLFTTALLRDSATAVRYHTLSDSTGVAAFYNIPQGDYSLLAKPALNLNKAPVHLVAAYYERLLVDTHESLTMPLSTVQPVLISYEATDVSITDVQPKEHSTTAAPLMQQGITKWIIHYSGNQPPGQIDFVVQQGSISNTVQGTLLVDSAVYLQGDITQKLQTTLEIFMPSYSTSSSDTNATAPSIATTDSTTPNADTSSTTPDTSASGGQPTTLGTQPICSPLTVPTQNCSTIGFGIITAFCPSTWILKPDSAYSLLQYKPDSLKIEWNTQQYIYSIYALDTITNEQVVIQSCDWAITVNNGIGAFGSSGYRTVGLIQDNGDISEVISDSTGVIGGGSWTHWIAGAL